MKIKEAGKNYGIAMYYEYDEAEELGGWTWAVECGYQCFNSRNTFEDPRDCQKDLESFLEDWKGPTK